MLPTSEEYTGGVRQLVRQSALSHTDWLKLIEARRALIEPHLRTMELKPIGKVKLMAFSREDHCIVEQGSPELISSRAELSFDTRCYYPKTGKFHGDEILTSIDFQYHPPGSSPAVGGDEHFWALTRSGVWIIVTATVQFPYVEVHRPRGYPIHRAQAVRVVIAESSVPEIILKTKTTPEEIWKQLGKLARDWHERRKELLWDAQKLASIFDFEDQLLCFVRK